MNIENHYMRILSESLDKKLLLLDQIIELNQQQTALVQNEKLDMDAFDGIVQKKTALIDKLNQLDDGFQSVYEKIREELVPNQEKYRELIQELQRKIQLITDKSISIQATEVRNKDLIEKYFRFARKDLRQAHTTVKAASQYYKNMSRTNLIDPQLMDRKK